MADQIKKLSAGHTAEVLDGIMSEVEEARGEYESLDARLDEISGEGYSKAEVDAFLALKQNALNSAQLAAVNSGIDSTKVAQIETNENSITMLRTFMAYVGYCDISAAAETELNKIRIFINGYYTGNATTLKVGCLMSRSLPLNTDLTVDNSEGDYSAEGLMFSGTAKDKQEGLGVSFKPYIEIDGVRHYGVQQRYFYNDL